MAASSRQSTAATRISHRKSCDSAGCNKTQANIDRYLAKLDAVDREEPEIRAVTAAELQQKIASMEAKMEALKAPQKPR